MQIDFNLAYPILNVYIFYTQKLRNKQHQTSLFEQNQDLFYLFDRFQHLKGRELHESMELREHASTVMATLDQSINSLSDYDNFVTYLHSIGKLHRKVPGFKRAHFWVSIKSVVSVDGGLKRKQAYK